MMLLFLVASSGALGADSFMQIRLSGVLGNDVTAEGVRNAIGAAARNNLKTVVAEIDATEGDMARTVQIVEAIASAKDVRTIAFVRNAEGVAAWVVLGFDEIFFDQSAQFGGEYDNGEDDIPPRNLGDFTRRLMEITFDKGRNPSLAQAMTERWAELWLAPTSSGAPTLQGGPHQLADGPPPTLIDSSTTILALSGTRATTLGIGNSVADRSDPEKVLGMTRHQGASRFAEREIRRAAMSRQKELDAEHSQRTHEQRVRDEVRAGLSKRLFAIDSAMTRAESLAPGNFQDYTFQRGGDFTDSSRARWRARTDDAIHAWKGIAADLRSLRDVVQEAERLSLRPGIAMTEVEHRLDQVSLKVNALDRERNLRRP